MRWSLAAAYDSRNATKLLRRAASNNSSLDYRSLNAMGSSMDKFILAPLAKYAPSEIVPAEGNDSLASFILALSVVFNDLKGLLLIRQAFASTKPPDGEVSSHAGEWRGIEIQVQRYTIALVHELLALIHSFPDEARGETITEWMKSADPDTRRRWRNLVGVALDTKTQGDPAFTKVLLLIRNNVASHYYQPKTLVKGYRRHFFRLPKSGLNEVAYVSLGQNMEQTRFYYADAALQSAIANLSGSLGEKEFARRMRKIASDINETLRYLLANYLKRAEVAAA